MRETHVPGVLLGACGRVEIPSGAWVARTGACGSPYALVARVGACGAPRCPNFNFSSLVCQK